MKTKSGLFVSLVLIIFSFFLFQCKKPKTEEKIVQVHDTVKTAWQEDKVHCQPEKCFMGVYSGNGMKLFIGSEFQNFTYDSIKKEWGFWNAGFPYATRRPAVSTSQNFFIFGRNNINYGSNFGIYFWKHNEGDWDFRNINYPDTTITAFPPYLNASEPLCSCIDISDSNRIVTPVITNKGNYIFASFDLQIWPVTGGLFKITNPHKLSISASTEYNLPTFHIGNRFFVNSTSDSMFLIREDLSIKNLSLFGTFMSLFKFNSIYYTTLQNGYSVDIYKTMDNGETWNKEFTTNFFRLSILNFDNKLIGIFNDRFWEVIIDGTNITFKEINNDGLATKEITGIIRLDDKVYISTNSGLFYRLYSNFYDYK